MSSTFTLLQYRYRCSGVAFVAVALTCCGLGACSDSTDGTGGAALLVDITSPNDCENNTGGTNAWLCNAVTIELSEPVPLEGLGVNVQTSLGDTFTLEPSGDPQVVAIGDPATAIAIQTESPPPHYAPTWIEVEMNQFGTIIGSGRLEPFTYRCEGGDDEFYDAADELCWVADPVTLTVTLPAP
jgi:hypothetical protein